MNASLQIIDSDVLIIGSGIAGLEAALAVSQLGRKPLLVSKSSIGKANNTILAGGAFTCATDDFDIDSHIQKTLESGCMLNNRQLVEQFVRRAPDKLKELREMGLSGKPLRIGFHCRSSALIGGPAISGILVAACRRKGIRFLENVMVSDLLVDDGGCRGGLGFHKRSGGIYGLRSKAVILATGGGGAAFLQNDNAPGSTGDGYRLALEAGLELMDMEFVQFYPLAHAGSGRSHMIIPALFADVGKIVNRRGEDLKLKYGLHDKPIAIVSRDRLSQALFKEWIRGNDVDGALLLDVRGVAESRVMLSDDLKRRFKKKIAYDTEPIKILPACHHTMGGLPIDENCRTACEGLFAAGEVAGGIHGANRMGGNALSEAMVFGEAAAASAVRYGDTHKTSHTFTKMAESAARKRLNGNQKSSADVDGLMKQVKTTLWENVGIIRSESSLLKGIERIEDVFSKLAHPRADNPAELCRMLECKSAAATARAIAISALKRTESRGAHFREDYPCQRNEWQKHIYLRMADGEISISRIETMI